MVSATKMACVIIVFLRLNAMSDGYQLHVSRQLQNRDITLQTFNVNYAETPGFRGNLVLDLKPVLVSRFHV